MLKSISYGHTKIKLGGIVFFIKRQVGGSAERKEVVNTLVPLGSKHKKVFHEKRKCIHSPPPNRYSHNTLN